MMTEALALEPQIERLARDLAKSRDVLYLGRGTSYPIALEGALKLAMPQAFLQPRMRRKGVDDHAAQEDTVAKLTVT
jgi:hypothetical protein